MESEKPSCKLSIRVTSKISEDDAAAKNMLNAVL